MMLLFWVHVYSLIYPVYKAYAEYYIVIYVLLGCAVFFHIIL